MIWGQAVELLISHLKLALARPQEHDLFVVAHKVASYREEIRVRKHLFQRLDVPYHGCVQISVEVQMLQILVNCSNFSTR